MKHKILIVNGPRQLLEVVADITLDECEFRFQALQPFEVRLRAGPRKVVKDHHLVAAVKVMAGYVGPNEPCSTYY